jgi:hypothetical protein
MPRRLPRVDQYEAAIQGSYMALHAAGTVLFLIMAALSFAAVLYHWKRFWREVAS